MANVSSQDRDWDLWALLRQTSHAMLRVRKRELAPIGLSPVQAAVLLIAQDFGRDTTPSVISRELLREPHTVSSLLDRMEKDGLITRVNDLDRKNKVRIALTDKGHKLYRKSLKIESVHNMLSVLSEEELQQIISSLRKLMVKALEELVASRQPSLPSFLTKTKKSHKSAISNSIKSHK